MIGQDDIKKAQAIFAKYKDGRTHLTNRIITNEQWYKQRHWELIKGKDSGDIERPEPTSGYLFNCLANKHADAMDNLPTCSVLPREQSDEQTAQILSDVLPVVLQRNNFEQVYSDAWHIKLRQGTAIYSVLWDSDKDNGLGDIAIKKVDVLNFYWEPGVKDIQDSKHIFVATLMDAEDLRAAYPKELQGKSLSDTSQIKQYYYDDTVDLTDKTVVIDWYYKKRVGSKTVLHFAKFVGDTLLFASENLPEYKDGFYTHGKYPFILDGLFPVEGTPFCFGYVDVCKSPQMYIDKLDQLVIENAYRVGKKRYLVSNNAGINLDEFSDWDKPVITCDRIPQESIYPLDTPPLDSLVLTARSVKVDELKETSGNRDFAQGGTSSGVTAASAIAALQEAGSKLSRDMIKGSYNAFQEICYLCIDLMRQFYSEPRYFRVTKDNKTQYIEFDNSLIKEQPYNINMGVGDESTLDTAENAADIPVRLPIFDIEVVAQKKSPFNRVAQNELIKELYSGGFFNPQNSIPALAALEAMDFDGVDKLKDIIKRNAEDVQILQQVQAIMAVYPEQLAQLAQAAQQAIGQSEAQPAQAQEEATNRSDLARAVQSAGSLAEQARERAVNQANPANPEV